MRYGFDKSGGFAVVDDEKRIGVYAYPTSTHATAAKKKPRRELTARRMLDASIANADMIPQHIQESHYETVSAVLAGKITDM